MDRNILFKCPRTGMNVQHRLSGPSADISEAGNSHLSVTCLACGSVHFVNSATGKLLADESHGRLARAQLDRRERAS
ncbi:hypothetical protein GCM10010987_55450 [Bradyrhizobium guangdongense]|uniref:Uncharacterized protein n=1 Tax=Bradyrhizobium guangdongense TaxID=1325090 RepID=A0A410VCG9_9BRAD|nr:hypothetical protein X265_29690 [Bradyrhizobium guangdongense]QOZ62458.1 hypothetical protein XH86_29725 [Bradyrhizobium guangdongense]GGI29634.1 hypothetical protein GCM10010987_55450 [Bradyrhizobium guangdongense]